MTCKYSNLNQHDALYNVVRQDVPGGVEAVAHRMGISPNVLRNKLRPSIDTHHTTFEDVSVIMEIAEECHVKTAFLPLQALCWRHGHVAIQLPKGDTDADDLLKQVVAVMGVQGNLASSISGALSNDSEIDQDEFDVIDQHMQGLLVALAVLREKVVAKHKADCGK